jgi:hydroxyacylglutathione hydrolase
MVTNVTEYNSTDQISKVVIIPTLRDNYSYIIDHKQDALIVDPSSFAPIDKVISVRSLTVKGILVTHDHMDHVNDVEKFVQKYDIPVYAAENATLPVKHVRVKDGFRVALGTTFIEALSTPGHHASGLPVATVHNNISWYAASMGILFTGDILFSCSYGSIDNADPHLMFTTLNKLRMLPEQTALFYGHEYFKRTMPIGLTIDNTNKLIEQRYTEGCNKLEKGLPTVPVFLQEEKATNPFLNCDNKALKQKLQCGDKNDYEMFLHLRALRGAIIDKM